MVERLTKMQTLPPEALPVAQWAFDAICSRQVALEDIRVRVNDRLSQLDLPTVSSSAFHRYATKVKGGLVSRPIPLPHLP